MLSCCVTALQFGVIVLTTSAGIMVSFHAWLLASVLPICIVDCLIFWIRLCLRQVCFAVKQDHEEARRKKVGGKVLGFFY